MLGANRNPCKRKRLVGVLNDDTIPIVAHPDVVLHRLITSLNGPGQEFEGYVGKLDLDKVKPESFRDLLKFQQQNASGALSLEGYNASGGTEHPPYHFDFLEVTRGIANAHAFHMTVLPSSL